MSTRTRRISILIAVSIALLLGVMTSVQFFSTSAKADHYAVRDGTKVTVSYHITLRDNPTTSYSDTEQFVQGQHHILPALEQRMVGMQAGETKTFHLSVEDGFGPYDETKTQTVQTADLPLDAREGDMVDDDEGRTAMILRKFPETTVLDLNHPLAGKPLIVTLQIVKIENPEVDDNAITGTDEHLVTFNSQNGLA